MVSLSVSLPHTFAQSGRNVKATVVRGKLLAGRPSPLSLGRASSPPPDHIRPDYIRPVQVPLDHRPIPCGNGCGGAEPAAYSQPLRRNARYSPRQTTTMTTSISG
jgi:hypothetical protein